VFVDESGFLLIPNVQRTWAPRGQTPFSKRARKGEVPRGTIYGDPIIPEDEDEDDDDSKVAMKRIRQFAKDLDESDDESEDDKKRKLKAFAKRWGVILRDADESDDADDDDDEDTEDAKRKRRKALALDPTGMLSSGTGLPKKPKTKDDGDEDEDDEMDGGAKRARGMASLKGVKFDHTKTRVSFASTIFPRGDGDRSVLAYPIDSPETMSAPTRASAGQDALNRSYADAVLARLGGGLKSKLGPDGEQDMIPNAGAGDPWLGTSRDVPNSGFKPFRSGEGDRGHIVTDKGNPPARTNQGRADSYTLEQDNIVPEGGAMVSVKLPGGMRIANPGVSGIRGPSGFAPSFNDSMMSVLKSSAPRRPGLFRNLITDGTNKGGSTQPVQKGEE
jgi:hypothetical protein